MGTTLLHRLAGARSTLIRYGSRKVLRRRSGPPRRDRGLRPHLEVVEERQLLSDFGASPPNSFPPAAIRHAYGFDQIRLVGGVPGDGRGQTIAIVVAFDDPNIGGDLEAFDREFGRPDPPSFRVMGQDDGSQLPPTGPKFDERTGSWALEESLDVEWAHAMAPGASILVVEADNNQPENLYSAASLAAEQPGVSVVSMSLGSPEIPGQDYHFFDPHFQTPFGHAGGVTFVASSGDKGVVEYPASSPNVLSVGGTELALYTGSNQILREAAWSGSGGGPSLSEALPSYQAGVVPQGTTMRTTPDVAYSALGYPVYDSHDGGKATPWILDSGTSAGAPQWAALIAIANQGRAQYGLPSLDGPGQTLPAIYSVPGSDFNDITSGKNLGGFSAGLGYDMVTGRGTPRAGSLVPDLVNSIYGQNFQVSGSTLTIDGDQIGDNPNDTITVDRGPDGGVFVSLNGLSQHYGPGDITRIIIATGKGSNTVNIIATSPDAPVTVDLADGQGTVNISPSARNLGDIQGAVTVEGTNGADVLNIDDQNNPSLTTYSVTSSTVSRPGAATITYGVAINRAIWSRSGTASIVSVPCFVHSVNLNGGAASDTYNIQGTRSGTVLTVVGGPRNDTFNISPTAEDLDDIQGNVLVEGGNGTNALDVFDAREAKAVTYSVTSSTVTRTGAATISYDSNVGSLGLTGGDGHDTYNIESTSAFTSVSVLGESDADAFNISPTAEDLNTIQGPLRLNEDDYGEGTLTVHDERHTGAVTYSLTSSSVTRTNSAPITYISIKTVDLDGGSGNDTYDIESTDSGTPVNIAAGDGNDTFNVSPTAKDLGTIRGDLTIGGHGGFDTLVLFDQSHESDSTYSITSSTITRTGATPISYASVEDVVLYSGSGHDRYDNETGGSPRMQIL